MAKPAIYWAICREPYSSGNYRIVEVTSESYGIAYGRSDDRKTSLAMRDILAKHDNEASAKDALKRAVAKRDELMPRYSELDNAARKYRAMMNDEIAKAAGVKP